LEFQGIRTRDFLSWFVGLLAFQVEMAPIVEILSEVGSAFVGTPSGSSSETLTTAPSSEDGSCKGPEIEGPEIALEDAVKSKYLQKYGSRAKLRPETNEWT
jgi:hypothetical protein